MRLELGTFPVREVAFGPATRYRDGCLEIDRAGMLAAVREDRRIQSAQIELARPGESVRIWPVRDVIEPRVKVEGPGVAYPGVCGRPGTLVGEGRTHRLAGVGVVEVSNVNWHDAGGDFVELYLDMSGPWAELVSVSKLQNVCLVVEPDPALPIDAQNDAVHNATLLVSDRLAATTRGLEPPDRETFDLEARRKPNLPGVAYIWWLHSPEAMSNSLNTFCTSTYGYTRLMSPWLLHPNEVIDGAISGAFKSANALSWNVVNNALMLELYRRHGVDFNFLGVVVSRLEWNTQREKDLMAEQTVKTAELLGAKGVVITWDAGGNEFLELAHTVRTCKRRGIEAVFMTCEESPGGPPLFEPLPEADAIVTTGFVWTSAMNLGLIPPVQKVIGNPVKATGVMWEGLLDTSAGPPPTAGPLPPPRRLRDHYGFDTLSTFLY